MLREVQFRDPVFKGNFTLFVSEFADVVTYLRDRDCKTDDMEPHAAKTLLVTKDGAREVVLWFPPGWTPLTPEGMGLLAHEALHAVHMTLQSNGVESSSILDEVGNYYLEWLVREVASRAVESMA